MNVNPLVSRIHHWVLERKLLQTGSRGILACSGGRDSLAMLHILHTLRRPLQIDFLVVCVDHGLRSVDEEVALVRARATELGLRFVVRKVMVEQKDGSLQAAAREARLAALEAVAREEKANWIASGHTLTDQAETVMFRLVRGAGLRGMGGIPPRRDLWIRPLLCVSREETAQYLSELGWTWADDPSNQDHRFRRVEIREKWFPMMGETFPGFESRMASTALLLQDAHEWMNQAAGQAFSGTVMKASSGFLECDVTALMKIDRRLRGLCLQRALERVGSMEIEGVHVQMLMELIENSAGTREIHLPGIRVTRTYDRLTLQQKSSDEARALKSEFGRIPDVMEEIPGQGCYVVGGTVVTVDLVEKPVKIAGNPAEVYFSEGALEFPLTLRPVEKGDRMRPFGLGGTKLISDVLVDRKIPKSERNKMQVLTSRGLVIWLLGVLRSDAAPVEKSCERVWRICFRRN